VEDPKDKSLPYEETADGRYLDIIGGQALSLDLVSAFAGDQPLTEAEKKRINNLQKASGIKFFSDILYSITHKYFAPEIAKDLWDEVIKHKYRLSKILGRNVRVAVATLDYLSNITDNMLAATLVAEEHIKEIIGLSLHDGLTGLFNHTYFYQQIDLEFRRYVRYGALVSLILIDIDDFKKVNDTYGHLEGDRILASMGKILMRVVRDSDICCRYGGEEFAVILPMTDINEAGIIANRIITEIREESLMSSRTVTVSIGVAYCGKNTKTYLDLVAKADAALYEVKRKGKNGVKVSSS